MERANRRSVPLAIGRGFFYCTALMPIRRDRWRVLRESDGQAATEYVVVMMLAVIGLITLFAPTMLAIERYLRSVYFFIGLPIP